MREDERQQRGGERGQHPAEGERRPQPPARADGQRQQHERRDRDRSAAAKDLRLEPVAVQAEDVELGRVARERVPELLRARVVCGRLVQERPQPERDRSGWHGDREEGGADGNDVAAGQ